MPQSLSFADRLLAPATSLKGRLRFSQKALLIGAAFTLTSGVLAGPVVIRSLGEISDARQAREAAIGLGILHEAQQGVQRRSVHRVGSVGRGAWPGPEGGRRSARPPST